MKPLTPEIISTRQKIIKKNCVEYRWIYEIFINHM